MGELFLLLFPPELPAPRLWLLAFAVVGARKGLLISAKPAVLLAFLWVGGLVDARETLLMPE